MTEKELRKKFVDFAVSYIGTKEGSVKHKYIIDNYNKIAPLPSNYKMKYTDAWCAAFMSFCAYKSELLSIIPAECSCNRMIALAKNIGIWVENDVYVPQAGDIILYDWNDSGIGDNKGESDHVGIVHSVSGSVIKVIEGNYSDAVGYRNISVNARYIRGFICPKFSSIASAKTNNSSSTTSNVNMCNIKLPVLKKGSKGQSVKSLQILLNGYGYSCGSIDGDFGAKTESALRKYQSNKKLVVDAIAGEKTWNALLN